MKSEQLRLYNHHVNFSKTGHNEENRAKHKRYAEAILKSYPGLIVEVVKEEIKEAVIKHVVENDEKVHKVLTEKPKSKRGKK